jgi:hypothetical protein
MWGIEDQSKIYWDLFIILLALYNAYSIPLEVSFEPEFMTNTFFTVLNWLIDFSFFMDIVATFRTSYVDSKDGSEIFDLKKIRTNYLQGRFIIDFLSTVPFDQIGLLITKEKNVYLSMFALLKLIRVMRLNRMITAMNTKDQIKTSFKLFQLIFLTLMYLHCVGCFWFFFAKGSKRWIPPPVYAWPDTYIYDAEFFH